MRIAKSWSGYCRSAAVAVIALVTIVAPALVHGQDASRDRWVGTWASAMVARPASQAAAPAATPQTNGNSGGAAAQAAATPPQNFNNCTICHAQAALVSKLPANGWIDGPAVALEQLTVLKRAGADFVLTYFATEVAEALGG